MALRNCTELLKIKDKKILVISDEDLGLDLAGGRDDPICPGENPVYISSINKVIFFRDEDPVLAKKPDPGLCTSNEGRFLKVF